MSAVVSVLEAARPRRHVATATPVVLLGVGNVGGAFLDRWQRLQPALRLVAAADSRHALHAPHGLRLEGLRDALAGQRERALERIDAWLPAGGVVVDATASDAVAARHPRWLAQGHVVVSANKAGCGAGLARQRRIAAHAARYGDSATVGAGLPLLRTVRALRAGGDRIHGLAGVLSGSLAWLLDRYDGTRPFSALVREAAARGYTEPDPRVDLSGADVRRKLLILARTAGVALAEAAVAVEPLWSTERSFEDADARAALDAAVHAHWLAASDAGQRLRFVARLAGDGAARVGLEALAPDDPLASGRGCDNRVALWSCRYRTQPLLIQGPGAGAEVTAAALLDDVLRLAGHS